MKKLLFIGLIFQLFCETRAQQTLMYTQYTFNSAGLNPAASGLNINRTYYYAFGLNRQWIGVDNAPRTNFVNFSYTMRPPRSYRFWKNVGVYADVEDAGLMNNSGAYLSFTLHALLRKKTVLSFGLFAGARRYSRSIAHFDQNDPAVINSRTSLILYPDIIPGFRITDKKFFAGVSARHLSITKLQGLSGGQIGGPSRLRPSIYAEAGKMIELSTMLLMMPSVAVNFPVLGPPRLDATLMYYYANRFGLGASLRNASFVSGILQIRILSDITAGFAYSYPINNSRFAAQNSIEFMIGLVPQGMDMKLAGKHSVSRCPTLSY